MEALKERYGKRLSATGTRVDVRIRPLGLGAMMIKLVEDCIRPELDPSGEGRPGDSRYASSDSIRNRSPSVLSS